jgi:hypothetical protein
MSIELKDILEINDFTLHLKTDINLNNTLSRSEIVDVILRNGLPLPDKDVSFIIEDNKPHYFRVTYLVDSDEYIYHKQKIAG